MHVELFDVIQCYCMYANKVFLVKLAEDHFLCQVPKLHNLRVCVCAHACVPVRVFVICARTSVCVCEARA